MPALDVRLPEPGRGRPQGYALNFRACSGAKIPDVTTTQLSALSASTRYVTISVGGNDAGFSGVLTECAQPGWASNCDGAINTAQGYINNTLPGALSTLYASIRSQAPSAKVVVVGYPRVFNGEDCNAATFFSPAEETRLNPTADLLNGKLAGGRLGQGVLLRQPDQPLRRARRLRQPGVAQRSLQPGQRELPPQPARPRLRLRAAGQPAADRRRCAGRPRPWTAAASVTSSPPGSGSTPRRRAIGRRVPRTRPDATAGAGRGTRAGHRPRAVARPPLSRLDLGGGW